MNGTYIYMCRTILDERVMIREERVDGRMSLLNTVNKAKELTRKAGLDSFKIVKFKGGDFAIPLEYLSFYKA